MWNAFQGCTALKEITIPESVTELGWNPFENCHLTVNAPHETEYYGWMIVTGEDKGNIIWNVIPTESE